MLRERSIALMNAAPSQANDIILSAKQNVPDSARALFPQFASLTDAMIKLCFHGGESKTKAKTISISSEFGHLKRMMPVNVIVPTQRALTLPLAPDGSAATQRDPFAAEAYPTVAGIREEVEVLASLQRPKKVSVTSLAGRQAAGWRTCLLRVEVLTALNIPTSLFFHKLLFRPSKSDPRRSFGHRISVTKVKGNRGAIGQILSRNNETDTQLLSHVLGSVGKG